MMTTTPSHHSPLSSHQPFTDIHCHLLPGIDDGPRDWKASVAMARKAVANGIGAMVATPHQLGRYEKNTADRILSLCAEAQQRIHDAGLPLTVLPGADVRIQEDLPELVENGQVLTLGVRGSRTEDGGWRIENRGSESDDGLSKMEDGRSEESAAMSSILDPPPSILHPRSSYLLMELPHEQVLPLGRLLYRLQSQGVSGILSHPERNRHLQENPEILRPWVQQGCLIQVTTGSITGRFGRTAQQVSRWLFAENLVHLVATDAHNATRRPPEWS